MLLVLATAGAAAYFHATSGGPPKSPLSSTVTSEQSVGLANPGPQAPGSAATVLYAGPAGLVFTPSTGGETVQPSQQWQADQMGGGGAYVFIFTPDGLCLTATGSGPTASAQLDTCATVAAQRWTRPYRGTVAGQGYWQLRSASTGLCLAAGRGQGGGVLNAALRPCSQQTPWQQLVTFWSAF